MKTREKILASTEYNKETSSFLSPDAISRGEFLIGSAAVGVTVLLPGFLSAAASC